jgi:hypothetical protein
MAFMDEFCKEIVYREENFHLSGFLILDNGRRSGKVSLRYVSERAEGEAYDLEAF